MLGLSRKRAIRSIMKPARILIPTTTMMRRRVRPTIILTVLGLVIFLFITKSPGVPQNSEGFGALKSGSFWSLGTSSPAGYRQGSNYKDTKYTALDPASPQYKYKEEHDALGKGGFYGRIFGKTIATLSSARTRKEEHEKALRQSKESDSKSRTQLRVYDPYPDYNSPSWSLHNKGQYVACDTPWARVSGNPEIAVYTGRPAGFPDPSFGSYDVLGLDGDLCFERESRLGPYGYTQEKLKSSSRKPHSLIDWNKVDWGELQELCHQRNFNRFSSSIDTRAQSPLPGADSSDSKTSSDSFNFTTKPENEVKLADLENRERNPPPKSRTAVLLRAYSGKQYSENDKQNIRSLITELSLRTGGEYQVFLLVQIKHGYFNIWNDNKIYEAAVEASVPKEFWNMTILWNDRLVKELYTKIPSEVNNVHQSQWLCVQKFSQDFPEFDYIWNWELDSRYTGHYYDLLERLAEFSKKQPRRGLWERNERFYIPFLHGDYETTFRQTVENRSAEDTIWEAPPVANVQRMGPKPPKANPEDDAYEWGVGEEADFISLGPIFNPNGTNWISRTDVWGYGGYQWTPRRATIITQSRVSRRLLNAMHHENLKGNHISSEMTPQTVALLHGYKAVFAPHPVYLDRDWKPDRLERWFNPGPKGEAGTGAESPFGWGKESRFHGSTWYYRAEAPMRLYNNWLGWEDTSIGGPQWEQWHGRTCLPPMLLHPIKDVEETQKGYKTESWLPYDDM